MEHQPVLCCSPKLKNTSKDSCISMVNGGNYCKSNKLYVLNCSALNFPKGGENNCCFTFPAFLFSPKIHSLTLTDGACSTGLRQTVALPHRAAQTDVHESLCGGRERSSARQQHPCVSSQQRTHPFEHQTEGEEKGEDKNKQHGEVEETQTTRHSDLQS